MYPLLTRGPLFFSHVDKPFVDCLNKTGGVALKSFITICGFIYSPQNARTINSAETEYMYCVFKNQAK